MNEIVCKELNFELFEIDVDVSSFDVCTNATNDVVDEKTSIVDWIIASKHDFIDIELSEMLKTSNLSLLNVWAKKQFDDWRIWTFNEFFFDFQFANVRSHFEQVMKFSMFVSKVNRC